MQKRAIKVNTLDALNWPARCPYCGQDLKEGNGMGFELKIKKNLKGLITSGFRSKNLPVRLCGVCAKKVSNFRTIEGIGGIAVFIAIIGPIVFKKVQTMEYIYIIGAAFWLGIIRLRFMAHSFAFSANKWATHANHYSETTTISGTTTARIHGGYGARSGTREPCSATRTPCS